MHLSLFQQPGSLSAMQALLSLGRIHSDSQASKVSGALVFRGHLAVNYTSSQSRIITFSYLFLWTLIEF